MSTKWPFPHQNAAPPSLVHAIGQLIMNWNYAEFGLQRLAAAIFNLESPDNTALLLHAGHRTLTGAIRSILPHKHLMHDETKAHILAGIDWFNFLVEERNTYAHSLYHPSRTVKLRRITARARGKLKFSETPVELKQVRALAEEISDLGAYLIAASEQLDKKPLLVTKTRKFLPRQKQDQPLRTSQVNHITHE